MDDTGTHPRHLIHAVSGAILGAAVHLAGLAVLLATWWVQRIEAPDCFPDEDGVFGTLLCSTTADAIMIVGFCVIAVRHLPRLPWPFLSGLVGGYLLGLVVVVTGILDVLTFIDTLGNGCGGSTRTPWSS
jgi:hypothetical protein